MSFLSRDLFHSKFGTCNHEISVFVKSKFYFPDLLPFKVIMSRSKVSAVIWRERMNEFQ